MATMETVRVYEDEVVGDEEFEGLEIADTDAVYSVTKMAWLLETGEESDQKFILSEVQQLLGHCSKDFQEILLPVLCENCLKWDTELMFESAQALAFVVQSPISPNSGKMVMNACIRMLNNGTTITLEHDRVFFYQVWSGILVESMQIKEMKFLDQELSSLLELASVNAKNELMERRKAAARIYGALATIFDAARIQESVLPDMLHLFNDEDVVVLGTCIESMTKITTALPEDVVDKHIWPRLMALTESEDVRIRCTALRSIAAILADFRENCSSQNKSSSSVTKTTTSSPIRSSIRNSTAALLKREVQIIKHDARLDLCLVSDEKYMVLMVQSEVFGELFFDTVDVLDKVSLKDVYKAFRFMAICNGPVVRRNVAFNFPGVAMAMGEKYGDWTEILAVMAKDKDEDSRYNLSLGMHVDVGLLLGHGKVEKLGEVVLTLLTDTNPAVTLNIVEHFKDIVEMFKRAGCTEQVKLLVNGFNDLKAMVDGSWRLQEMIATQLRDSMDCYEEGTVAEVILPLVWKLVQQGMPPVRKVAAQTIVHCLRRISDKVLFEASVKKYYVSLASLTHPHRIRLAIVEAALEATEVFSSLFFKLTFAAGVLSTCKDPVSNVRVKLATSAHKFAPICADSKKFRETLEHLRKDKDPDVADAMRDYPKKSRQESKKFTQEASLLLDQKKLFEEREFYKVVEAEGQDAVPDMQRNFSDRPKIERNRTFLRKNDTGFKLRASSLSRRTSSFTNGIETENVEEEDMGSTSISRAFKRLSGYGESMSFRRFSSTDSNAEEDPTQTDKSNPPPTAPDEETHGDCAPGSHFANETKQVPFGYESDSGTTRVKRGLQRVLSRMRSRKNSS